MYFPVRNTEAYSEPCRASKIKHFAKIVGESRKILLQKAQF